MPDKMEVYEYDEKGFREVKESAKQVYTDAQKRATNWEDIKDMVFMTWESKNVDPNLKVTISPGPRNKIIGLRNLLSSTLPQFNVPKDRNNPNAERVSSALEHGAGVLWNLSNRVQGKRVEADMVVSATVYDEIHLDIVSTGDKVKALKAAWDEAKNDSDYDDQWDGPRWKSKIDKAEQVAARTPYLFLPVNPEVISPVWSGSGDGLIARYKEAEMKVADIRSTFGERAIKPLLELGKKDYHSEIICEWLDGAYRYTWLKNADRTPIIAETHGLNFMPCVAYRVQGTDLFLDPERTNEPFLFGVRESGIWQTQNTLLTAIRTAMNTIGLNAQMYYKKASENDTLAPIDHSVMGGVVEGMGELRSMMADIITRDIQAFWNILDQMFEDSTIYGTALGEKLSGTTTFSETALLAQQGRLPIVPIKRALEETIAQSMNIACMWMKQENNYESTFGELDPSEIPDVIEFEVNIDPNMAQDKVQAGTVAQQLVSTGIVSKEWARDLLGEGQSDQLQNQIYGENMSDMVFQAKAQGRLQLILQAVQELEAALSGGPPSVPPGGPEGPGGPPLPPGPPQGPEQGPPPPPGAEEGVMEEPMMGPISQGPPQG